MLRLVTAVALWGGATGLLCGCTTGQLGTVHEVYGEPSYATMNIAQGDHRIDTVEAGAEDLSEYDAYGAEGVVLPWPTVPVGLEVGANYGSTGTDLFIGPSFGSVDVGLDMLQLGAGVRVYLHRAGEGGFPLEPFVAVGIARVYASVDVEGFGVADSATGSYLRAGVQYRVSRRVHLGFDWRRLEGAESSVEIVDGASATVDFDSDQFGVFVGLRF